VGRQVYDAGGEIVVPYGDRRLPVLAARNSFYHSFIRSFFQVKITKKRFSSTSLSLLLDYQKIFRKCCFIGVLF
jgi:hypothetical protein